MLRVYMESLIEKDGIFYYKEEVFSGLAYCFDIKGLLNNIYNVHKGIKLEVLNDILEIGDHETLRVHLQELEKRGGDISEPRYYFQNRIFEGFAYEFNEDGSLLCEIFIEKGIDNAPYRIWYSSGSIQESWTGREENAWYENGKLKNQSVLAADGVSPVFNAAFDENGKLVQLYITDKYPVDLNKFKEMEVGERLLLKGKGINDQVLEALFLCFKPSYTKLAQLDIQNDKKISGSRLVSLIHDNIKYLTITGDKLINTNIVNEIRENHPDCNVIIDDNEE